MRYGKFGGIISLLTPTQAFFLCPDLDIGAIFPQINMLRFWASGPYNI